MDEQIKYLESRLSEIESATTSIMYMLDNEDSGFADSPFMKSRLSKLLFEGAAARRLLVEVKNA